MPIYRIADLNVEVNPKFKICRKRLESYAVKSNESGKTDIAISVSDDEIRERLRLADNLSTCLSADVNAAFDPTFQRVSGIFLPKPPRA